ncbi:hypothetical protein [uncultured Megasphaera sp.]|jgi:hypothetical protein|uniref:hypothetical protein n=1 Tax=uncultured Megasphaera sp. TaxID=165188 RepID=UPI0025831706|nr:hypothetical protein [uncultured Megasphaera sp.]
MKLASKARKESLDHMTQGDKNMLDVSMQNIRKSIDTACLIGLRYAVLDKTGIDAVDAEICATVEESGYKIASNTSKIIIQW